MCTHRAQSRRTHSQYGVFFFGPWGLFCQLLPMVPHCSAFCHSQWLFVAKSAGQWAMWLLETAMEREGKAELQGVWNAVRERKKSDLIFSYLPVMKSIYSSQNRHLTLGSFGVKSSVNIKIKYTILSMKIHYTESRIFFFFIKRTLTFSLAFLFVPASIHSFSVSSMSIKAQRIPSINSSICKEIPRETGQNQEDSDRVF